MLVYKLRLQFVSTEVSRLLLSLYNHWTSNDTSKLLFYLYRLIILKIVEIEGFEPSCLLEHCPDALPLSYISILSSRRDSNTHIRHPKWRLVTNLSTTRNYKRVCTPNSDIFYIIPFQSNSYRIEYKTSYCFYPTKLRFLLLPKSVNRSGAQTTH